jgi:predicted nucleic acid-binding OB-fold protein
MSYILDPLPDDDNRKPFEYWLEQQERNLRKEIGDELFELLEETIKKSEVSDAYRVYPRDHLGCEIP